ncbi:MAG: Smr/MutS family protein [Bdellovibrionota bacterium]
MGKKQTTAVSVPTLDLHGVFVDDVFDRIDQFLRREEAKGTVCVRILHGKGTGKVEKKAREYCGLSGHQPKADKDPQGRQNPGSFLLYL